MHLGINDVTAVRSISMFIIVVLVIILCNIKATKWSYFCYNRVFVSSLILKISFGLLSNLFLLQIMIKDCRTVLCPNIVTLPVKGRGIVCTPENVKYFLKIYNLRIKFDLYRFCIPGSPSAYLFIRRVFYLSSRISRKN